MKKTLSILLTLVMLLTFVPVTAFAASAVAMTVTPSASSVDVGDSVTVTVAISGNAEKAVGMQASLTYDPTVLQYESFTPKNANFKTSDFNLYSAGNFVMLYEDPTVTGVDLASDIVEVTFTALAPSDSSSVALNIVEFYDNNDEDFSPDMTGASTSIAVTAADVAAPTLTDTGASNLSVSGATISFTSDEAGTYYYVALPASDPTPIASAVKGGVSGSALVGANSVDITGLAASTAYKVCLVVSDGADNTSEVAVIEFTTASASAPVTNVQVELTAQAASAFLFAPQNVTVSSDLAESYGYTDSVSGVSALDALVRAHELTFGTGFTTATAEDYLIVNDTGGITKEFGVQTISVGFAVNGISPNDGVYVPAYGGNTGYTITQAPIQTNDLVEFYFLEDSSWMDQYVWFSQDGAITDSLSATAGIPADITLEGYYIGFYGCNYSTLAEAAADKGAAIEDAQLALVDAATGALTDISGAVTDEDGNVSVTFPLEGTFILTAYMPQEAIDQYYASPIILPLATVTVVAASAGAATPTFDTDLSTDEVSYIKDQPAKPLTVAAIVTDGGTVTYQWYGSADNSTFSPIDGEADASYTPSTSTVGTMYYYVVATNTLDGSTATATSSVACVTVTGTTATAPTFDTDLSTDEVKYVVGMTASELTVSASAGDEATLSYQWYSGTAADAVSSVINGAISESYTPDTTTVGTTYYKVVVTNTLNGLTAVANSAVAMVTVQTEPVLTAVVMTQDGQQIPGDEYQYNVGDTATAFKVVVTADVEGGNWSYAWRRMYPSGTGSGNAKGERRQVEYTPSITTDSSNGYFCRVTYTLNGGSFTVDSSNIVTVKVFANAAETPSITTQPVAGECLAGSSDIRALTVSASRSDGGTLSYQWYISSDNVTFAPVEGATADSYTPAMSAEATTVYYRCKVTNTLSSITGDVYTASANSDVVTLTFKSITDFGGTWAGTGTEADPFLIGGIDDLNLLWSLVNTQGLSLKGMYFKLTTSLTLPSDWVPLGGLKAGQTSTGRGTNIWPFSGTLDGGNYTVTVPEDGLPLFGYVRKATVKNLNIYGEKIAGYGLVNNYTVDYGPQGQYDNTVDNRTITIDNVTLKTGSSTLNAGFIGGYASGVNEVNINNSTIEAGVVIGYTMDKSKIGSFAGDFNGTVNNSVSHATVYGENYVGGLVSSKGQSMGVCAVRNSLFDGTVTATGNYAGGIMGSGYTSGSAPNTPCVSIQNCYVSGSITAADYLGGIIGGELACKQCWANGIGYIQNNYFSGTLTATATEPQYVGGIIGFMKSLDRYNIIENNYYLSTSAQVGIGQIEAIDYTTEKYGRSEPFVVDDVCVPSDNANFASGKIAALLNSGNNSDGIWTQSGAYPVFGSASTATHKITLTVTGNGTAFLTGLTTADDTVYQNAGSPVTVTTTAESGNSLSSITVSDGSTTQDITNDGEFIMLQQDVTVEVIFAVSASPANGVTVTPTVAGDTASGTVDLTGVSVETGAAFTVTATTGNDDVTRLDLTFTNETLAALANAGKLVIHTDFGDITLDADAIANLIANAGGGDVTLTVEAKAASELPEAQQGAAANADMLLEISLTSGGSPIAFNNGTNGTMTIEVPFTPSSPDIDVTVYYIDETGTRTAMTSSCADGKVTFATTHLSLYAIEEEKSAYTVNLTTANTDRNVGETITAWLNVSGAADYASLQTTVSYDKTKVSYTDNALTGFTVTDNAAAGTLTISRFGSTTSTGLQGYLTFTVNPDISTGSSEAAFSVASAVVGVRGDPSDAAAAGTGTDISVDVHNLTVTFEAGDHVTMATATAYVKYGVAGLYTTNAYETTFTYPNPSADTGCTLDAPMWTDGTDRTSFGIISETVFTANAVYTATATVDVYDIVYELDGGTNDTSNPATYSYGDSFTLADPAKENCTFVGWYADDSFTTPVTGISATDTGDKTFYARWQGEVTITLPSQVTVVSGVTDGKANYGTDVVFTVTADPGYTLESVSYTVGTGSAVTLTVSGGQYTIPGTALTDDVTVTVTQHVTGSVTFITFEDYKGAPMGFKVLLLEATVPEGYKYQYDGTDLFKSDKYAKYACFVPADVDAETALYTIACVAGTAPVINYDGNVNQSPDGAVTSADAQLIYDLYTGLIKYVSDSDFSKVSEKMRLAADINGDGTVDTADAQIVVNSIHNIV